MLVWLYRVRVFCDVGCGSVVVIGIATRIHGLLAVACIAHVRRRRYSRPRRSR